MKPPISEAARLVTEARDFLAKCVTESTLFDPWANRFDHAKTILNSALAALDSAHPTPKEGEAPETDAFKLAHQYKSPSKKQWEKHARSLELRLAEKVREVEHLTELVRQQSKTLGIIKDSECALRTRLNEAEAVLLDAKDYISDAGMNTRIRTFLNPPKP